MEIVERPTGTQGTVLVADDEPDIREMLSGWIVDKGGVRYRQKTEKWLSRNSGLNPFRLP